MEDMSQEHVTHIVQGSSASTAQNTGVRCKQLTNFRVWKAQITGVRNMLGTDHRGKEYVMQVQGPGVCKAQCAGVRSMYIIEYRGQDYVMHIFQQDVAHRVQGSGECDAQYTRVRNAYCTECRNQEYVTDRALGS